MSNHSYEVHRYYNRLDHFGIILVLWGSSMTSTFLLFRCDWYSLLSHCLAVSKFFSISGSFSSKQTTITALLASVLALRNSLGQSQYRLIRTCAYYTLGFCPFIAISHSLLSYGRRIVKYRTSLYHFIGLAALNSASGVFYLVHISEIWFPRRLDIIGKSPQIMHVLVVFGALTYWCGLQRALDWWSLSRGLECW